MSRTGMLLDLKRCVGCGACVVACQLWSNQSQDVSWIKLDTAEWGKEIGESGRVIIPHACMHCSEPPCVEVCPTGASHVLEDGTVVVDYEACINCGSCITVCPYDARVVNKTRNNYFHSDEQAPYEAYGEQRVNVVEKCNFCYKRMEEDLLPACVVNCPGNARYFGDLEDSESDVAKRLAWGDAIQIDDTAFYYAPVTGMPESELPFAAETASAATTTDDGGDGKGGISPVAATVGVAAVAAVGAGIGIGVKKARKGTVEEDDNE